MLLRLGTLMTQQSRQPPFLALAQCESFALRLAANPAIRAAEFLEPTALVIGSFAFVHSSGKFLQLTCMGVF